MSKKAREVLRRKEYYDMNIFSGGSFEELTTAIKTHYDNVPEKSKDSVYFEIDGEEFQLVMGWYEYESDESLDKRIKEMEEADKKYKKKKKDDERKTYERLKKKFET